MKWAFMTLLLLIPLASAHGDVFSHFVKDGDIISPIIIGDDAPTSDTAIAAEIVLYLEQGTTPTLNIVSTASSVDISDGRNYLLIGTPENNPAVKQALGLSDGDAVTGPFLSEFGDWFIISGASDQDVRIAAESFKSDNRRMGALDLANPESAAEELVEQGAVEVPEEEKSPAVKNDDGSCNEGFYCAADVVMERFADCSSSAVDWCAHGCEDGECRKSFFKRLISTLFGWMPFVD